MQLTLINDLLDLAKFETMNFRFNIEYFDLCELIDQAYQTVKYQANQKHIQIHRKFDIKINDIISPYYGLDLTED